MRMLIVGSTSPWAIEQHYIRHLSYLGIRLNVFDPSYYFHNSLYNRGLLKLRSLLPFKQANNALITKVEYYKPEIIWIFKGAEFTPETLVYLKNLGIKLINYNPDHPFIRTSAGNGGKNIEECVHLYDFHLCYSRSLSVQIKKNFGIATAWLPFGFELDELTFYKVSKSKEILRISFVGNPDKTRARIITSIAKAGLPIDVYGNNWNKFLRRNNKISIFNAVYDKEYWHILRKYRIQLNIFRPHNFGSHNMRTFEVPAVGGIMLTPDSLEQRDFFTHEKEVYFYSSENEMLLYCHEILTKDNNNIRNNARLRSIEGGYTYRNRAKQAFEALKKQFENV